MKKTDKKVGKKTDKKKTGDPVFGTPVLLPGEDETAYAKLLEGVIDDVKPKGMIEKIWVQDLVRLTWDVCQYRMFRVQVLTKMHFKYQLNPGMEFGNATRHLERLEQLIAAAEHRRNVVYWELERRRDLQAQRLRESLNRVEAHLIDPPVPLIADQSTAAAVKAATESPQYSNDNVETVAPCDCDAVEMPLKDVGIAECESVEAEDEAQVSANSTEVDAAHDTDEVEAEPADSSAHTEIVEDEDAA